jgi:hypothetical protein
LTKTAKTRPLSERFTVVGLTCEITHKFAYFENQIIIIMFAQKLLLTPTTTVTGIARRRFVATSSRRFKSTTTTTTKSATEAAAAESPTTTAKVVDDSVPIGASLLAAIAGVGVVAASAFVVENLTADTCLPFSTNSSDQRYSQDTFQGRFSRMLLACDPCLLVYTESQIQESKQILLDHDESLKSDSDSELTNIQNRLLWESRRIVESAIHPDTGELIPRPFRMSGYVPYNGPICVSMVASSSTIPLLFWSWINQTQNALVNYYVSKKIILKNKLVPNLMCFVCCIVCVYLVLDWIYICAQRTGTETETTT